MSKFGGLGVLVNNSGVYEFVPIEAITEESFHRQFNINVLGLLLVTKHAVHWLAEHHAAAGAIKQLQRHPMALSIIIIQNEQG